MRATAPSIGSECPTAISTPSTVTCATASQALIPLLAMLIMPGVVGVFFVIDEFAGHWTAVMIALGVGTFLSVLTTLWLMLRFMPKEADSGDERGRLS